MKKDLFIKKLLMLLFICACISCSKSDDTRIYTGYIVQYEKGNFLSRDEILVKTDSGKLLETTAGFKEDLFTDNSIIAKQYMQEKRHIRITVSGDGACLENHGITPIK